MNESQALEQAGYLNELIEDYIGTIEYVVFAYWNTQYEKLFATTLIPTKYNDNYDSATNSQQLAFARVALKTLVQSYDTAESYVTLYDAEVLKDAELSNYLKG